MTDSANNRQGPDRVGAAPQSGSEHTITLAIDALQTLVERALTSAGATPAAARHTAIALVNAEAQGLGSHGLSRVAQYAGLLSNGRCNGAAVPTIMASKAASALIDAQNGLAFPACALAIETGIAKARECGSACVAVTNSHHFGVAAFHLQAVAAAGMVGLAMGNSPAAMPVPGGRQAVLGTNPLAACFPRRDAPAIVIDLALSEAARGKIMVAARDNKPIPPGWALDAHGEPTTDARAALAGSMLPVGSVGGGVKGGMIALMIELLAVSLTGAHFGSEADSFFQLEGNQPRLGQVFFIIDPAGMAGGDVYASRIDDLVRAAYADSSARLPGPRRQALLETAQRDGIALKREVIAALEQLVR